MDNKKDAHGTANAFLTFSDVDETLAVILATKVLVVIRARRDLKALQASEAMYHRMFDTLPINVTCKGPDLHITFANQEFCKTLHSPLNRVLGRTDFDFYPRAHALQYRLDDRTVLNTGRSIDKVEPNMTADGRLRYVRVLKVPVSDAKGKRAVQIAFWDVTEEHRGDLLLRNQADLRAIEQAIAACRTTEKLFDYCVNDLAKRPPFSANFASILTFADVQHLHASTKTLVLRRTSYSPLSSRENRDAYSFSPDSPTLSLTEWVGTANIPPKLQGLASRKGLQKQLRQIDRRIRHKAQIVDSREHSTFLAVPISIPSDRPNGQLPLGVLRLTQKERHRAFSDYDQTLLESIARDYKAPRLGELLHHQFTDRLLEYQNAMDEFFASGTAKGTTLRDFVSEALKRLFVRDERPPSGKFLWISRFCGDGRKL